MTRLGKWLAGLALCGATAAMLVGCSLIPQPSKSMEELAGRWDFVDSNGIVSALTIDVDGRFEVDPAPVEVFRLPERLAVGAGTDPINWESAVPIAGVVMIGEAGRVSFVTLEPAWGAAVAYENPFERSLEFVVGDVDRGTSIDYKRDTDSQ